MDPLDLFGCPIAALSIMLIVTFFGTYLPRAAAAGPDERPI